jgi:hypothetical protein
MVEWPDFVRLVLRRDSLGGEVSLLPNPQPGGQDPRIHDARAEGGACVPHGYRPSGLRKAPLPVRTIAVSS